MISYTKDFLSFESHFEIKIQNPVYESMRLPLFRLCFESLFISQLEINNERIKYNKTDDDFNFYSLLLEKRNFNAKTFFESGMKVEFYEFNDINNGHEWQEMRNNFKTEIHLLTRTEAIEYFDCFSYDSKKIKEQKLLSKMSPFMKISFSINSLTIARISQMHIELNENSFYNKFFQMEFPLLNRKYYSTFSTSISKYRESYLENPYSSQCSYYDKSQNPFDSVSHNDCLNKCLRNYCYDKHKCHFRNDLFVIHKTHKFLIDSNSKCNDSQHNDCTNYIAIGFCIKFCPIDCFKEDFYFKEIVYFYPENDFERNFYFFWDSKEVFVSCEETPDILLIDYFTYIGGLFGLWFGICLENLIDLIVKHTRILRSKIEFQFKNLLEFIHITSICLLYWIYDLITIIINSALENMLSIQQKNHSIRAMVWRLFGKLNRSREDFELKVKIICEDFFLIHSIMD
jgi:hypothetical protein